MASIEANGITIEYRDEGVGDPLLLIMGLGGQLIDWPQGFVGELTERGFRVIRFDNRDAGLSTEFGAEPPTIMQIAKALVFRRSLRSEYQLSDMAADAVGLLDALGVADAHVAGMSMGGMIAQTAAIEHPGMVRSLTSVMSNTGDRRHGNPAPSLVRKTVRRPVPTRENAVEAGLDFFRQVCGPTFDEAEFRVQMQTSIERSYRPAGTARQSAAILASPDRTAGLRRLDVPTLVVHGLVDPLVRPSGGIATAKAVPDSRLVMYNDMGHDIPETRWGEMADAIRRNADRAASPAQTRVAG
jgi:pimeloyl-ACP methyl ester carboxylesterase